MRPPTRGSSSPVPCPLVVFPADHSSPPLRRPSHPCGPLCGLFRAHPIGFVGLGCALTAIYGRCHLGLPNSSFLTSLFSRLAGLAVVIRSVIGGGPASSVVGTQMLMKGHPDHDREMDALLTDPGPRPLGGLVVSRHVRSRHETVVGWTANEGDIFFLRSILVSWLQLYLGMFFTLDKSNFFKLLTSFFVFLVDVLTLVTLVVAFFFCWFGPEKF